MASYSNKSRKHVDFTVGQNVLLHSGNLPLPGHLSRKLAAKWIGPFPIVKAVSPVAFQLALPDNLKRLHDVFHVSLLKLYEGKAPPPRPPVFQSTEDQEFEVAKILASRIVRGKKQYLVQWKGYGTWDNTWEPVENLKNAPLVV